MAVIDLLADAYNRFVALPVQHPADAQAFCEAIHRGQHIVMKRGAQRAHPEVFR